MIIETAEKDVRHPEGKILLMNGSVLECYPTGDPSTGILEDKVELDKSGEFLQVGHGPRRKDQRPKSDDRESLFLKEAFFLYEHRDKILADSRMFLTPLPFENNLAYTGTSGLDNATLGVYLEWWDSCEKSVIRWEGEVHALTYFIAGSPLSGSNRCSVVLRDGRSVIHQFPSPFYDIWGSFMRINKRYSEAKQIYQAYSIEETFSRLYSDILSHF